MLSHVFSPVLVVFVMTLSYAWEDLILPRVHVPYVMNEGLRFRGNETSKDYFRLLEQDADYVLVGAKNMVYNISLRTMSETSRIEWHSKEDDIHMCQIKGKSEEQCQNYIRVLAKKRENKLFVCGTNAFKPQCREYVIASDGRYKGQAPSSAQGLCPYDPVHNSTALFVDGELYVATTADFSGTDAWIFRDGVRTEQYDLKHLNEPNFVSSFEYKDYVFFFFREMAVEYTNCGKAVYSRVGRVCKKDRGGPHTFQKRWTSFTKARLNCSVPGQFPFYFNQIQSASDLVKGIYGEEEAELVYATFTTDPNSIWGSAVCAFNMRAILDTFSGPFKEQEKPYSNWLPVKAVNVPEPRPGQCVENSTTLTDVTLNFVKNHPLMDEAVPNFFPQPVFIRTSFDPKTKYRFTKIAVDPQVRTTDGRAYDVLFIGTDDGRLLKVVNSLAYETRKEVNPVVIEDIQVFQRGKPVTNLHLVGDKSGRGSPDLQNIVVISDDELVSLPIQRCYKAATCSACVALQDPYCGWNSKANRCSQITDAEGGFIQKVSKGESPSCPDYGSGHEFASHASTEASSAATGNTRPVSSSGVYADGGSALEDRNPYDYQGKEQAGSSPVIRGSPRIYSAETFAIAVTTAFVVALIVGFCSGYMFSRRCRADDLDGSYTDIRFPSDPPMGAQGMPEAAYMPPSNNKSINLVINVPPKNNSNKNPNSAADNKPIQKVKKIYL